MSITYTIVGVPEAAAKLEGSYYRMYAAVAREMPRQMVELRNYAVSNTMHGQVVSQRSGNLVRNVVSETEETGDQVIGRVGIPAANTAPYARILHDGGDTRAHVIEVRNAQALRFTAGGQTFFRKRVNHPGSHFSPRPYLMIARDAMAAQIRAGLVEAMKTA